MEGFPWLDQRPAVEGLTALNGSKTSCRITQTIAVVASAAPTFIQATLAPTIDQIGLATIGVRNPGTPRPKLPEPVPIPRHPQNG